VTEKFGFHIFEAQVSLQGIPAMKETPQVKNDIPALSIYKQENLLKF